MEMKKLRARMVIVWSVFILIMWVVLPVFAWWSGPTYTSKGDYLAFFLWDCFVPVIIVPMYKSYRRHCISYGNGKIIIKRERKRVENGRPVGKWEVRDRKNEHIGQKQVTIDISLDIILIIILDVMGVRAI